MSNVWEIDLYKLADDVIENMNIEVTTEKNRNYEFEGKVKAQIRDLVVNNLNREAILGNMAYEIAQTIAHVFDMEER